MSSARSASLIAFYPNARGFAYVVFEGPLLLVDWGISEVLQKEGRESACVRRVSGLIDRYSPDYLVLRAVSETAASTARVMVRAVENVAGQKGVSTYRLSRKEIQLVFLHLESQTRHAIAQVIAKQLPILAPSMPPPRKIWNGENGRMGLFDAAALGLSFFRLYARSAASLPDARTRSRAMIEGPSQGV